MKAPKDPRLDIPHQMRAIPLWSRRGRTLRRTFEFSGFARALDFVNRIGVKAEKMDHHPDIDIRWNTVHLALTTHHAGRLTLKDFVLARQCDLIFARHARP